MLPRAPRVRKRRLRTVGGQRTSCGADLDSEGPSAFGCLRGRDAERESPGRFLAFDKRTLSEVRHTAGEARWAAVCRFSPEVGNSQSFWSHAAAFGDCTA